MSSPMDLSPSQPSEPRGATLQRRKTVRWADQPTKIPPQTPCLPVELEAEVPSNWKSQFPVASGLAPAVLHVLHARITINGAVTTILKASTDPRNGTHGKPVDYLLQAVESRVRELSLAEQRELYEALGWHFGCIYCGVPNPVGEYEEVEFFIWDRDMASLRSGPCKTCKQRILRALPEGKELVQ